MSLWICITCATAYSVGATRCPQCGSEEYAEDGTEESEMAKITRHGGSEPPRVRVPEEVMEQSDDAFLAELAGEPEPEVVSGYETWLLVDLQAECEVRGLAKSGTKAELAARLIANDEADDGVGATDLDSA